MLTFIAVAHNIIYSEFVYADDINTSIKYMNETLHKLSVRLDRNILRDDIKSLKTNKYELLKTCNGKCSDNIQNEINNIDICITKLSAELIEMEKK